MAIVLTSVCIGAFVPFLPQVKYPWLFKPTYIGNGLNEIVERNDVIEHFALFLWNSIELTPVKANS